MEFSAIMGHSRAKELLSTLVGKDKLPHALLFSGPWGVGKKSLALEMAKNVFCQHGRACMACRSCRNIVAGVHPDLLVISGEGSIKIDELRALRKEVCEPPYEGPMRVILIDNADKMTREAANALLKTLEEPPPNNLFVLITSKEQELPLTVRSRCMRIGFGTLSSGEMRSYFTKSLKLKESEAELISSISNGSIADGLFWVDKKNFQMRRTIAEVVVARKANFGNATLLAEKITKNGHEMEFLGFLLSFLRDVWWLSHAGDQSGVVNQDLMEILAGVNRNRGHWAGASIRRIQTTMQALRYNVNRWLTIEHLMINIMGHKI
jgi:DNA polymerase III subunit delta'